MVFWASESRAAVTQNDRRIHRITKTPDRSISIALWVFWSCLCLSLGMDISTRLRLERWYLVLWNSWKIDPSRP